MSSHHPFNFKSLEEVDQCVQKLGLNLPLENDVSSLLEPITLGKYKIPNRFVVLPMEGCDGLQDGSPDELTYRRYQRFAAGGAGVLWFEATAVVPEGRANPRQLWLHEKTVDAFARMVEGSRKAAASVFGENHQPLLIVQLTHSGRYSRPSLNPQPIIAHHSKYLDPIHKLPADYPLISDEQLQQLEDRYVEAAICAQKAGFHGVDVKACHRYLISELHASYTRTDSIYGGSFENRSRLFRNIIKKIQAAAPNLLVTSRMNAFDAMAYPYGFGMNQEDPSLPDLAEPSQLVEYLHCHGTPLVNITIGNPYFNPFINRPFDQPTSGAPLPPEHPLVGVERFVSIVREIQFAKPKISVIGGGYSWLRQFFPNLAAAVVKKGWASLIGLGRMSFAYPDFARDLMDKGKLNARKVCIACSACTQIMRDGGKSGCVPRDASVYAPIYKAGRSEALDTITQMAKSCRQCNDPSCVSLCPAEVNIPKFVGHIAEGRFREAYETLRSANVLAAICGYVCPSETLCESGCINQHYADSVPIRHLQQWISRRAIQEGWISMSPSELNSSGCRVAVIGAGPAGIAATITLAAHGHEVTLMDRTPFNGGMAKMTIPAERLPHDIIRREIEALMQAYEKCIRRQQRSLSSECTLDRIFDEGFNAILIATGLPHSSVLPKANRPQSGVLSALDFLEQTKQGLKIQGKVLVLGGGNTAIDAALSAKRAGANDVSLVYRRSFAEMPAWPNERDEAIHEGINILSLTAPLDYIQDSTGKLTALRVIRTQLGEKDAKGRRSPQPLPGTEHNLPVDWVIEALGQEMDRQLKQSLAGIQMTDRGLIWTQPNSYVTSRTGVYAAGDVINGGATVVEAVAQGSQAAREIDLFISSHEKF